MQEEKLMFSNCIMVNQELFFVEALNGLPTKMNPENGDVSYYNVMDNFILKGKTICDLRTVGDRVYALGTWGDSIIIFDLEKSQCQYISLQCAYRKWGNFVAFEQYGSNFYIFPRYENKICVMNIINNEISETTDYFAGVTELQCACRAGNKVWLLSCDAGVIGCFDLENGKMQVHELKKEIRHCVDAVYSNGSVYILNRFGIIYRWNTRKMELDEEKLLETEYSEETSLYVKMVYAGNKLIILPASGEEIKILDLLTDSVEIYHDYPGDFLYYDNPAGWSKYFGICQDDNYYYCAMRKENYLLKINKEDGSLWWIKPNMPPKEERMKILIPLKIAAGERFFLESDTNIGIFLDGVPRKMYSDKETNVGEVIFEKVKQ